ncbi:MAG: histidine phosphatase family protein [Bacteroidota bacterium]
MKQLFIVRHAKASNDSLEDFDRPLNEQGINDAQLIAEKLKLLNKTIDCVICSSAKRTRSTFKILNAAINASKASYNDLLYHGTEQDYFELIKSTNDSINTLMIVGHNPSVTALVNNLSSASIFDMATSSVAIINFDNNKWSNLSNKGCNLEDYIKT